MTGRRDRGSIRSSKLRRRLICSPTFSQYDETGLLNRHPENGQEKSYAFRMPRGDSPDEKSRRAGLYVAEFISPYGFTR